MARRLYGATGAVAALCAVMAPVTAVAQNAPADRIDAIERQIRNLQNELQQLKNDLGDAKQQLRQSRAETQRSKEEARQARQAAEQARQDSLKAAAAQSQATQAAAQAQAAAAAPPPQPVATAGGINVGFPGGRPTISSSDGSISFAIGNQTQFDYGTYFQNPTPTTQFPHLNYGVNLRRERIFLVAKYDDWTLNVTPDFGGSPDGNHRVFPSLVLAIRFAEYERFPAY